MLFSPDRKPLKALLILYPPFSFQISIIILIKKATNIYLCFFKWLYVLSLRQVEPLCLLF